MTTYNLYKAYYTTKTFMQLLQGALDGSPKRLQREYRLTGSKPGDFGPTYESLGGVYAHWHELLRLSDITQLSPLLFKLLNAGFQNYTKFNEQRCFVRPTERTFLYVKELNDLVNILFYTSAEDDGPDADIYLDIRNWTATTLRQNLSSYYGDTQITSPGDYTYLFRHSKPKEYLLTFMNTHNLGVQRSWCWNNDLFPSEFLGTDPL